MKRNKIKSSQKFTYIFVHLSKWTGYLVALLAVFIFVVNKNPEGVNLIPVARFFFEAAKISLELEGGIKKFDKPPN